MIDSVIVDLDGADDAREAILEGIRQALEKGLSDLAPVRLRISRVAFDFQASELQEFGGHVIDLIEGVSVQVDLVPHRET